MSLVSPLATSLVTLFRATAAAALVAGTVGLVPAQAQAQTQQPADPSPAAVSAARELIMVKGGNAVFDPIVNGVIEYVKNAFLPTNPQLGKELGEVALQLRKDYESKRAELLGEVAKVYAQKFSEAELKELVTFYKSPLGKKMATEEPGVIDQGLKRAQVWADAFSEQVMSRFREEMKKKGHTL
ncbi:DUF2059 domain-containing protein [Rhodoplanes sp. SY1]|uniref:DUF2059 domain-containing protein n=1 Tax=Rhodoplanes sp. SY1 TaxID=3166646 RepID=UPI0038B5E3AF